MDLPIYEVFNLHFSKQYMTSNSHLLHNKLQFRECSNLEMISQEKTHNFQPSKFVSFPRGVDMSYWFVKFINFGR